jgi:ribosomal protein RSM22 (predicted rRNA methylase)
LSKLGSKWFGAHVVAPCPHDGRCPLSGPGAKAWCHFGTRFQRPGFMQVGARVLSGRFRVYGLGSGP